MFESSRRHAALTPEIRASKIRTNVRATRQADQENVRDLLWCDLDGRETLNQLSIVFELSAPWGHEAYSSACLQTVRTEALDRQRGKRRGDPEVSQRRAPWLHPIRSSPDARLGGRCEPRVGRSAPPSPARRRRRTGRSAGVDRGSAPQYYSNPHP